MYFTQLLCIFLYNTVYFFTLVKIKKTNIHRGQALAAAAGSLNKTAIAIKAGYSRSSYYNHIENKDLSFHILTAYGKAMKYDFTVEFPEMPKYLVEDPEEKYGKTPTLEEAIKLIQYWKDKYIELIEEYKNKLKED